MKTPIEVRVYTDYTPIRIFYCFEGEPDAEAVKAGLAGSFTTLGEGERNFPADRKYRAAWVFRGGKVVEDATIKAAVDSKHAGETQKREDIKSKLNLTDEEFKIIQGAK